MKVENVEPEPPNILKVFSFFFLKKKRKLVRAKYIAISCNLEFNLFCFGQFDFLGKDSIRYQNEVEVELPVFKAIQQFRTGPLTF